MKTYKIADLLFNFECTGRTEIQALPYLTDFCEDSDFELKVNDKSIEKFKRNHPDSLISDWEYFLLNIKFSTCLIQRKGFVLHSSAVAKGGNAYLFSADSGVGKSTHTNLWCNLFEDAFIINDDKPALRFENDSFYCYGTPWSGSSPLNRNVKLPVKGICFIERSNVNSIYNISDPEIILEKVFTQTLRRTGAENMSLLLETLDLLIKKVPFYRLCCRPDEDAALLAYNTMSKSE